MKIVRVEAPSNQDTWPLLGEGPYQNTRDCASMSALVELFRDEHGAESDTTHPSWGFETWATSAGEGVNWFFLVNGESICGPDPASGFASMTSLMRWFNRTERELLVEHGFKASVYEVPSGAILFGSRQVAFDPRKARLHAQLEIPA